MAAGTPDVTVATGLGTPDGRVDGPYVGVLEGVADLGPVEVSAPALLSQAADRADVEGELNALRTALNAVLAHLRGES